MRSEKLQKTAAVFVIAAAVCILLREGVGRILGIFIPFLGAWVVSAAFRPLAQWTARKSKMSPKVCGGAVTVLVLFFAGYFLFQLSGRLISEASDFVAGLGDFGDSISGFFHELKEKLPFSADFFESSAYETVIAALQEAAVSFGGRLTSFLTAVCTALPGSVLSFIVFVAAFYHLTADRNGVRDSVLSLLPDQAAAWVRTAFSRVSGALFCYLRAYLMLMGITFFELLVGLSVLGAPYAFVLSLIIAIVDALPVLGAGAVLGPWATVSFLKGDTAFAVGLIVLLGIMYLVRQVLEPKLIGKTIGVHPLCALAAVYAGYRLGGVFGMMVSPVVLYILKSQNSAKASDSRQNKA